MLKRAYIHIQELLPEITQMVSEGKTQREIVEHFGIKDKYVISQILKVLIQFNKVGFMEKNVSSRYAY